MHLTKYQNAVLWIMLASFFNVLNDFLMQRLSCDLSSYQISFLRFFVSAVIIYPFLKQKKYNFAKIFELKIYFVWLHIIRILIGVLAMLLWCYGLRFSPLYISSQINLLTPLITIILASLFLKEKSSYLQYTVLLMIVVALSFLLYFNNKSSDQNINLFGLFLLMMAAVLFAGMDIINKKLLLVNDVMSLIWYFAAGSAIIMALILTFQNAWNIPLNTFNSMIIILLGCGANMVLYCLLKAFKQVAISSLSAWRYCDLIFAFCFDLLFNSISVFNFISSTVVIISGSIVFSYLQKRT